MHHRKGYQMKRKEAAGRPLFSTAVGRCVFQSLDGISSRVISLYCSSLEGDQSTGRIIDWRAAPSVAFYGHRCEIGEEKM